MKRHERPYGCTFLTCNKTFGSKNDWKRHENSQHYHLETWRCDEERPEGGACAKVCYRRQSFQDHLKRDHQLPDDDNLKTKLEDCRIGRNCQARFWCGFCTELIVLKKKGLEAWAERFDHIDDHFMGRKPFPKQSIQDWVPVDSDKPRGNIESPHSMDGSSVIESQASHPQDSPAVPPDGKLPESASAPGGSPADAAIPADPKIGTKRTRASNDEDEERPAKASRTSLNARTIIYCVSCHTISGENLAIILTHCSASAIIHITQRLIKGVAIATTPMSSVTVANRSWLPMSLDHVRHRSGHNIGYVWIITFLLPSPDVL